jgi:hypothetical protein
MNDKELDASVSAFLNNAADSLKELPTDCVCPANSCIDF